jgi:CRISPR-associated protein Cmr6
MSPVQYCVPKDTAAVVANAISRCEHVGLLLTRFSSNEAIAREATASDRYTLERDVWLKQIVSQITYQSDTIRDLVGGVHERWFSMTEGGIRFAMIARERMVVGLGAKGALEMGITLHHTTGLPYIPGSALKGLARSYALLTLAAQHKVTLDDLEDFDMRMISGRIDKDVPEAPIYREIFGQTVNQKYDIRESATGSVVFYDAVLYDVPNNVPGARLFTLDVMTPHFPKYYRSSGGQPPNDADGPNPVTFLTVNAGLIFAFAVGMRGNSSEVARNQARKWLRAGLQEMGIGAKTAAGYGVFAPPPKA